MLQIQYGGAELKLPDGVDMDVVSMIDLVKVRNYYIACGYTDLQLGIDGLAAVVLPQFGGHLDKESLFLFCGRRTDRIKALYWSGDGYTRML